MSTTASTRLVRLRSQSESQANGVPVGRTLRPHSRYSQNSDGPADIASLHGELKRDRESVQKWDVSVWNDGVNRHRGKRVKMDPVHAAQAQRPNPVGFLVFFTTTTPGP